MKQTAAFALVLLMTLGCPGPKGDTGVAGHTPMVLDANSVELGTLVGTSMSWTLNSGGALVPGGQMVSYRDANGVVWNVGFGGGAVQPPNVPIFFASTDCSGPVLVRNASPYVPVASVVGTAPLKGVFQATTVAGVSPQSWIAFDGTGVCVTTPPTPNPAPQVTVYRNTARLGDYPMAPKPAPLTIGP
jgi:hypothetical protein